MTLRRASEACRAAGVVRFDEYPDGDLADRMRGEMTELSGWAAELEHGADEDEACEWILARLDYLLERWIAFGLHRGERGGE